MRNHVKERAMITRLVESDAPINLRIIAEAAAKAYLKKGEFVHVRK